MKVITINKQDWFVQKEITENGVLGKMEFLVLKRPNGKKEYLVLKCPDQSFLFL